MSMWYGLRGASSAHLSRRCAFRDYRIQNSTRTKRLTVSAIVEDVSINSRGMRIVVAGGGLVGLTAAASLRRDGHQVTVLEQAMEIRAAGAGIGLWPNALREFDRFGIGAEVRAKGHEIEERFFDPGGRPQQQPAGETSHPFLFVPRPWFNRLLAEAAGRDRITMGARVIGYTETSDEIRVHLDNADDVHADLLLGADGVYSRVRAQLLPGSEAHPQSGNFAWRAIVPTGTERPEGTVVTLGRDHLRGGYTRVAEGETMWFIGQFDAPARTGGKREHTLRLARHLARDGWHDELLRMIAATPEDDILENQVVIVPTLPRWTGARVALIGDAAHGLSPHVAAGGTLGIEDVSVLRAALASAPTLRAALEDYERLRMPRFEQVRTLSHDIETADDPAEYARRYTAFSHWMLTTSPTAGSIRSQVSG
ncbi:FAD-dependent oxidoreductase [Nocardia brasiliensis]|uniref:FAD-dependent oxidoreductase n=1 Tax=Nocardia brasiliensis TaxID=37326 RepID=UPI0024548163|nr:FAD-dependent monooxygenase [Nocardia brasiliensis]